MNHITEQEAWFWMTTFREIEERKKIRSLKFFAGDVRRLYYESNKLAEKEAAILTADECALLGDARRKENALRLWEQCKQQEITMITFLEETYPKKLKNIFEPPLQLFVKGSLPKEEQPLLAVIGARDCSSYGKEVTTLLTGQLCKNNVRIISGLARGIDSAAHWGARRARIPCYAVLGCGVEMCYPKENKALYDGIISDGGGILSEYPPQTPPLAFHFPRRNRIISGLSDGILVTEAKEKSGTLITVSCGLEQGKDIYAVPGRLTDENSAGTNRLIQAGAKLVLHVNDILEELTWKHREISTKQMKDNKCEETKEKLMLATEEEIVYANLSLQPKHMDEIALLAKMKIPECAQILAKLELRNVIKQTTKNYYIRNICGQIFEENVSP